MSYTIKDLHRKIEALAPRHMAESWDNVGLLIGDEDQKVNKVLLALDATPSVIDEAIAKGADLIVTHHPLIFKGIKNINNKTVLGKSILKLIKNNIGLISAHTNLDTAWGGTNDVLASLLGLEQIKILEPQGYDQYKKIVVYAPKSHSEQVREAMCEASAGHIGNYSHCTFNTEGVGTFKPSGGTNPYIGSPHKLEKVDEIRIETIVKEKSLKKVLSAMESAHPYEEIAYDIYNLEQKDLSYGIGRYGVLSEDMTLEKFTEYAKERLNLEYIQYVGHKNKSIRTIALCTGSGMDYVSKAQKVGADVYLTGDIRYHDAQDALFSGMSLVNASHYGTEVLVLPFLEDYLRTHLPELNIVQTNQERDPFTTL